MANIKVITATFGGQNIKCNSYTTVKDDFVGLFIEYEWIAVCPGNFFDMPIYVKIEKTVLNNTTSAIFNKSMGCWGTGSEGHISITGLAVYQGATYYTMILSSDPTFTEPLMVQYQCNWINYATVVPQEPEPVIPIVPFEPIFPPIGPLIPTGEKGNNMGLIIGGAVAVLFLLFLITRRKKKD